MAYIEPNGVLELLHVPFDTEYENTMYFPSIEMQNYYMDSLVYRTFNNLSYTRKGRGVVRVESTMANCYNANYMRYKNTNFENKWFYAFVNKVEYINNVTVEITFTIDVMQTWLPNIAYQFNDCFIERQHQETDEAGDNLQDEMVELGPYIYNENHILPIVFHPALVIASSYIAPSVNPTWTNGLVYEGRIQRGNTFEGCAFYVADLRDAQAVSDAKNFLDVIGGINSDYIIAVYIAPLEFYSSIPSDEIPPISYTMTKPTALGSYTPHNKKLLTSPYSFLSVTNKGGSEVDYYWQLFANNIAELKAWGNRSCVSSVLLWPCNYDGVSNFFDKGIESNPYPLCSWNSVSFVAYLSQVLSATPSVIQKHIVKGTPLYNVSQENALSLGIHTVNSLLNANEHHGGDTGALVYQCTGNGFFACDKHILPEFAEKIDSYFDMYGYAINRTGKPNINARPYYTYVKTRGCSIDGSIPADDEDVIEKIFDKGIRFWTAGATFGSFNYAYNPNYPVQVVTP